MRRRSARGAAEAGDASRRKRDELRRQELLSDENRAGRRIADRCFAGEGAQDLSGEIAEIVGALGDARITDGAEFLRTFLDRLVPRVAGALAARDPRLGGLQQLGVVDEGEVR